MNDTRSLRRLAAITAIVATPLALASLILTAAAGSFNVYAIGDPTITLTSGSGGAYVLSLAFAASTLGFGILMLPSAVYMWRWLRPKSPGMADMYTIFGICYLTVQAVSTAFLYTVWPSLVNNFGIATTEQQKIVTLFFDTLYDGIVLGVLGMNFVFIGVWLIGMGSLMKSERTLMGVFTMIVGVFSALSFVAHVTFLASGITMFTQVVGSIALVLTIVWPLLLGVSLLRSVGDLDNEKRSLAAK